MKSFLGLLLVLSLLFLTAHFYFRVVPPVPQQRHSITATTGETTQADIGPLSFSQNVSSTPLPLPVAIDLVPSSADLDDESSPLPKSPDQEPSYRLDDPGHCRIRRYQGFDLDYDDRILAPRWTAYKLTRAGLDGVNAKIKRDSKFWSDELLAQAGLLTTNHYDYANPRGKGSFDRGHMVPFADAKTWGAVAAHESFATSNIVPQCTQLNEGPWEKLEEQVRSMAREHHIVWVVTGPIYDGRLTPFIDGKKVPAPTRIFKSVCWKASAKWHRASWIYPNHYCDPHFPATNYECSTQELQLASDVSISP